MFHGVFDLPWWGYVLVALAMTQVTIAAVTLFLHRGQAHKAVEFHPVVAHFFRLWLWLSTGMVTREWVAVHRKHHARVETADDPHSPQVKGIHKVLWLGAWLYRQETTNPETLDKYGAGTPDDWIERRLYSAHPWLGITTMFGIDILLFGVLAGGAIWLVQMVWIPFWAAGVINGIGHYLGYRNFEVPDASKNIVPWGVWIGGEELHNNHHAYASSAKFSCRPWECDIGWAYLKVLGALGLARVKKTAPVLVENTGKQHFDGERIRGLIQSRFQIMADFAHDVLNNVHAEELRRLNARLHKSHLTLLKRARRLMAREYSLLSDSGRAQLKRALDLSPALNQVYAMKLNLQVVWTRSAATQESVVQALEDWCRAAEASGIEALRDFSRRLRRYDTVPA